MEDDFLYIGERELWGATHPFGLSRGDRRQHVYIVGKTGTGKTTLLRNLVYQDIHLGSGIGLIDVHGDLAEEILDIIPQNRLDDVVYFRPGDPTHSIGLNLLDQVPPERRHLVASDIVAAFRGIWRASWGPRTEYVLHAAVAALLECPGTTLLGIQRMLIDPRYRLWVVDQVTDPVVKLFWVDEFEKWDLRFRNEVIAPIQNKIGQLLMTPALRNVLGQPKRKIDFRDLMDQGGIFIANLKKAELGEDKANLLGSFIVSGFEHAAMSRAELPEEKRTDFALYIDEFQSMTTDSFSSILSESRKYGLSLTLSHQFTAQLKPEIAEAVFGNVGTIATFRVGHNDAERLSKEFGERFPPSMFSTLGNHRVCMKLLEKGQLHEPFQGGTFPPLGESYGFRELIIFESRIKFAVHKVDVEDMIRRWFSSPMH